MRTIAEKAKVRREPLLDLEVEEVEEVLLVEEGVGQVKVQAPVQAAHLLVVSTV